MERRKMLNMLGIGAWATGPVLFGSARGKGNLVIHMRYLPTWQELEMDSSLQAGEYITTLGYYQVNDGGAAQYQIDMEEKNISDDSPGIYPVSEGLIARLINVNTVNYALFGAKGDGETDDGEAILAAHQFANHHQVAVSNSSGRYRIDQMRNIPIETDVQWGQSVFLINESYNINKPVFHIRSQYAPINIPSDGALGRKVIGQIKPGVQVISELKDYENYLIHLQDDQDRIAFRAGESYSKTGRPREELIFVSQLGRILGDVAWEFKPTVQMTAYPGEHSYLVMEGGTFLLSGQSPESSGYGYTHNGILVTRSRTRIRRQWVGIEPGRQDDLMVAQNGFYYFTKVYDVQMEDIRLNPREKNRPGKDRDVPHGTYGIGGNRVLEFSMIRVTAEGTGVHWGIFGTNMMKNVSLSHCRINRFDVHFHLWNLTIADCEIGHKGITVTGGGRLHIVRTICTQNRFVNFRQDFGAKWDGDVHLSSCILQPLSDSKVNVLEFSASDFEYGYPIGIARSIAVDDMIIDYSLVPENDKDCWLMSASGYSVTGSGNRLFFPSDVRFRDVKVKGRTRGIRVVKLTDIGGYFVSEQGSYDGDRVQPNTIWQLENVDLQNVDPAQKPENQYHVQLVKKSTDPGMYDTHSPHLNLIIRNCPHFSAFMPGVRIDLRVEHSGVHRLILNEEDSCEGEAYFEHCNFVPVIDSEGSTPYELETTLGTTFTNCVIHLPVSQGDLVQDQLSLISFMDINKSVKYNHLNTRLSNNFVRFLKNQDVKLKRKFKEQLMLHSGER